MYYVNEFPNEAGNHGNPVSNKMPGMVALPIELLRDYTSCKGFVFLTIADGTVVSIAINQEAYDNYMADHPDDPGGDHPSPEERIADLEHENTLLRARIQAITDRNDFIEDCIAEMAEIVYA